MAKLSKRMSTLKEKLAGKGPVGVDEAVSLLKGLEATLPKGVKPLKFDQTVTISFRLGIDPRQADQLVRGSIVLPHGIGKAKRVVVFAQGANAEIATQAGADFVGAKDLADKINKEGFLDFDVAIATPDMMGVVGPLGKVLGPRGLMPSPRAGTVTNDVANAIREYKAGKVEFRNDAAGNVHCVIGKLSFDEGKLLDNLKAMINYIVSLKPGAAKGVYVRNIALTATMSPAVIISPSVAVV